jgi:hypothetical protein
MRGGETTAATGKATATMGSCGKAAASTTPTAKMPLIRARTGRNAG